MTFGTINMLLVVGRSRRSKTAGTGHSLHFAPMSAMRDKADLHCRSPNVGFQETVPKTVVLG